MDPFASMCQFWPTNKNLQQLSENIGCSLEGLLGKMDDWEECREREREREIESQRNLF